MNTMTLAVGAVGANTGVAGKILSWSVNIAGVVIAILGVYLVVKEFIAYFKGGSGIGSIILKALVAIIGIAILVIFNNYDSISGNLSNNIINPIVNDPNSIPSIS